MKEQYAEKCDEVNSIVTIVLSMGYYLIVKAEREDGSIPSKFRESFASESGLRTRRW